jgi:hypothetical protein
MEEGQSLKKCLNNHAAVSAVLERRHKFANAGFGKTMFFFHNRISSSTTNQAEHRAVPGEVAKEDIGE